ncbi:MAG TPA: PAS domain S-box protein, partial [Anaerolineales bacterium]
MTQTRILVVEDENIVALDIKRHLISLGYEVADLVDTGEQAILKAGELRPDLVLMDIKLKGAMDGIQAADEIRNGFGLPVIFLTAYADEHTLARARVTEAFGYILKPFEARELSTNIEMAIYKHKMEQALRENETRLRTVYRSAQDGLFIIDRAGRFVDVNPAGCELFGYTLQEFLDGDIRLVLFPDSPVQPGSISRQLFTEGRQLAERRMRRKDGAEIWVEMTVVPLELGSESLALGSLRDISERRRSDAALRESEERYMLAAQGANDGLWDWRLKTGSIYFSPRWKAMLGFSESEVGSASENRKPCHSSHSRSLSWASCSGVSTPSAIVSR